MDRFDYTQLPLKDSIDEYVKTGRPVGGFLEAILTNNLMGACDRADHLNIEVIPVYMAYLYNECPGGCFGSMDMHLAWLDKGGLNGMVNTYVQ